MSSSPIRRAPEADRERRRILEALVEVCIRDGYAGASVEAVAAAAGLSRADFERHFTDLEDCFADYILGVREEFLAYVGSAIIGIPTWREQIRASAYAIIRFWQEDEVRGQMTLVEVFSAGPRVQLIRDVGMQAMIELIDQGRQAMPDPELLTRATAEAIAGAIFNQLRLLTERGEMPRGEEQVPQLMYSVVLPYLGTEAALEELEIPPPATG